MQCKAGMPNNASCAAGVLMHCDTMLRCTVYAVHRLLMHLQYIFAMVHMHAIMTLCPVALLLHGTLQSGQFESVHASGGQSMAAVEQSIPGGGS